MAAADQHVCGGAFERLFVCIGQPMARQRHCPTQPISTSRPPGIRGRTLVAVPYKQTMKTAAGFRMLVVPAKMLELIRLSIDAFLTDPIPGHTNGLVPGVHEANRSGQQGYVHVREDATIAEGLATSDLGFRVTSHLLRKSLATDLAWQEGIGDTVQRRCMGPRAGDDVFGRICALEHPQIAPLVKVAANLDDKITASIGFLLTPTTRRPHWGKHSPLRQRAEHISATLTNAGWLVDPRQPRRPPLRRRTRCHRTRHPPQHRPKVDGRRHRRPRRPRRPSPLQPPQRGLVAARPPGALRIRGARAGRRAPSMARTALVEQPERISLTRSGPRQSRRTGARPNFSLVMTV